LLASLFCTSTTYFRRRVCVMAARPQGARLQPSQGASGRRGVTLPAPGMCHGCGERGPRRRSACRAGPSPRGLTRHPERHHMRRPERHGTPSCRSAGERPHPQRRFVTFCRRAC
jgi:hypothetical protein